MPATSKKQQKFMGIVHAIQKGEQPASKFSKAAQKAAKSMKKKSAKDYASTKHKGLPSKVKKEERDYKAEYKKFQSSTKAKKYRAELNQYNRKRGTYGNGDGKDASHKGGKIVGFEKESKNRGRAEKSRLKKEAIFEDMNDTELAGRIKHWASKHKGTGIGYGHVLGQLAVHMKEMGWDKSFKEVVKVAKELSKKKKVESVFAVKGKEGKDGYRIPENPEFKYDPEKKESVNEDLTPLRKIYSDLDKKFPKHNPNKISDVNKIVKFLGRKLKPGSQIPQLIASFYNDYKSGEDISKNQKRFFKYTKKMSKKEKVFESLLLEFDKYRLGGLFDSKLKKRLERTIKVVGGKVDALGEDYIKFRMSGSSLAKLPAVIKKLDRNKNVWISDRYKTNIWDRRKNIDRVSESKQKIQEGMYDPGIFKAVFLAGGPGSGKTYVASKLFGIPTGVNVSPFGLKMINQDAELEYFLKKFGFGADLDKMPTDVFRQLTDPGYKDYSGLRTHAKQLSKQRLNLYKKGRLGMIVDGTGHKFKAVKTQRKELMDIGYDTYMVFVNTSLEVAQKRNMERPRKLPSELVELSWKEVQNNMAYFQGLFGSSNFLLVDNSKFLSEKAAEKKFNMLVTKGVGKFMKKPIKNKLAKKWIEKQKVLKKQ